MTEPGFHYYLITDRTKCAPRSLPEVVGEACRSGVKAIQLREKDLSGKALYELAGELREITSRWDADLYINGRADIAMAVGADGVHCREEGIGPGEVKKLDPSLKVGASVHSLKAARVAEDAGADFLLFGPVYYTPSKAQYGEPQGTHRLTKLTGTATIPVFAVGGITPEKAFTCRSAGAYGVAGISSVMGAGSVGQQSVEQQVEQWKETLEQL